MVLFTPFAHGHPRAGLEEPMQGDVGAEAAEVGDGADGRIRSRKQGKDFF